MSPWLRRHLEVEPQSVKQFKTSPAQEPAGALGESEEARAIDGLTAATKDSHAEVRRAAARALAEMRHKRHEDD
jgi:HEAT repeat protein